MRAKVAKLIRKIALQSVPKDSTFKRHNRMLKKSFNKLNQKEKVALWAKI